MALKHFLGLTTTITFLVLSVQGYELNMTQYYLMPSLYNLDDYDRCLQEFNTFGQYCFVRADIIPKPDSEAWQAIEEISKYYKHHFNHRHLYFGICVRQCESHIAAVPESERDSLFRGILTNNSKVNTYLNLFKSEEKNRQRFNRLTNQCVNLHLIKQGLTAESVVEYCDDSNRTVEDDTWNFAFYAILCTLTLMAIFSSLFDFYLKHKRGDKLLTDRDHYKSPPDDIGTKIGLSFSLARNWYRLSQEPNGRMGRELRFLDCFKVFSMFLVIFAHTNMVLYEGALSNPQDPERLLHTLAGSVLVAGSLVTSTFFVIGGLLLTLNWLVVAKQNKKLSLCEYFLYFIKFNIFRYIRLTIPYAFVVMWNGVSFDGARGPMWRHIVEREQLSCRKNWWINLFYLNNYINTNERCMLQSWYLAADTQSFVLSLIILMLAHRWPKARNGIYATTVTLFVALPGILTYLFKFSPMLIPSPITQRNSFIEDEHFKNFYAAFYMNFACYFFGVLSALICDHLVTKQISIRENKFFKILFYTLMPIGILWHLSGHYFYQSYNVEDMRLWSSIYAAVHRNAWSLGVGIFIIGMSAKCGWVFRKFCCLPIFRILGRLTYGAFMVHLLMARIVIATTRDPIYFGPGIMFAFIIFTMTAAYAVSFLLAILLEFPVSSIMKLLR